MPKNESSLSLKQFYDYTARQIGHEEGLINNRLSWMLTFQGFLFAALALLAKAETDHAVRLILKQVIPVVGTAVALLAMIGVHAAYLSINNIKAKWKQRLGDGRRFPPAHGTPLASRLGRIPSYGIPLTIVAAWLWFGMALLDSG